MKVAVAVTLTLIGLAGLPLTAPAVVWNPGENSHWNAGGVSFRNEIAQFEDGGRQSTGTLSVGLTGPSPSAPSPNPAPTPSSPPSSPSASLPSGETQAFGALARGKEEERRVAPEPRIGTLRTIACQQDAHSFTPCFHCSGTPSASNHPNRRVIIH